MVSSSTMAGATWIDAGPFRAHLRHLVAASGMSWSSVAILADIPMGVTKRLMFGRNGRPIKRICPEIAVRLYRVTPAKLYAARYHNVSARPVISQLRELADAGWSVSSLAAQLGIPQTELRSLLTGTIRHCPQLLALQVLSTYTAVMEPAGRGEAPAAIAA